MWIPLDGHPREWGGVCSRGTNLRSLNRLGEVWMVDVASIAIYVMTWIALIEWTLSGPPIWQFTLVLVGYLIIYGWMVHLALGVFICEIVADIFFVVMEYPR